MSNYSDQENSVRVDFFKPSGKWYTTEAVLWYGYDAPNVIEAFKKSLRIHFKNQPSRLTNMWALCLEPYHMHPFPLMINNWEE